MGQSYSHSSIDTDLLPPLHSNAQLSKHPPFNAYPSTTNTMYIYTNYTDTYHMLLIMKDPPAD